MAKDKRARKLARNYMVRPFHPDDLKIPPIESGMSVGLFGGSFNPPHDGHVHVVETALKRLQLDRVWWMVSPGNPLKNNDALPPLSERIVASRALVKHPRVEVSGLEASLSVIYTADLVRELVTRFPTVRFVLLIGADNLTNFHLWERWEEIADNVPIAVIDRPGDTLASRASKFAHKLQYARLDERGAPLLKNLRAPAWTFIHAPRSSLSSTHLRKMRSH
ncbi:MAG: nicotinate-nucleotide adenylyltransferase [Hyphomicrobiales bacterium]